MSNAPNRPKVLFILSSADKAFDDKPIGFFASDVVYTYNAMSSEVDVTFASPKGHSVADPSSFEICKGDRSLKDQADKYQKNVPLSEIRPDDYDAAFVPGGHGPSVDLIRDGWFAAILSHMYRKGKPIAAICHGAGVLGDVVDDYQMPIYYGREATAFSNVEEEQLGVFKDVYDAPEECIKRHQGKYVKAAYPWGNCVIRSNNEKGILITGQNPVSAYELGYVLVQTIRENIAKN